MKKVISFSLYGKSKKYLIGALENIEAQKAIYPDWICRFYIDSLTVPIQIVNDIYNQGCEVILKRGTQYKNKCNTGRFWRFEVMLDADVDRFIVRDADSRLNLREKQCVDQWIESGKSLHIMRDHPHHGHRIMAGMWGGINKKTKNIDYFSLLDNYRKTKKEPRIQWFLADKIYPLFKGDMLIHDNRYFFKDENPLKINRQDEYFIGQIYEL